MKTASPFDSTHSTHLSSTQFPHFVRVEYVFFCPHIPKPVALIFTATYCDKGKRCHANAYRVLYAQAAQPKPRRMNT